MTRVAAFVIALLLAGCVSEATAGTVPEINLGRDLCIECGMAIDDARFAAVYWLSDGTERRFDDLGDLIIHARKLDELAEARVWVADFETGDWLAASAGFYVPTLGVTSPMGHGLLAFGTESDAAAVAEELGGSVIGWEVVRDLPVIEGRVGHHHAEDHEESNHEESDHDM